MRTSPTWKDLRPLVKVKGLTAPVASSHIVPLGDGRFAAVARMTSSRRGERTEDGLPQLDSYDLILLLVEPAGAGWKLAVQYSVFHYALVFDDDPDSVPVRITPGDFDQDGRIELELRYRWAEMQRGIGGVSRTHVLLVALESAPRIALHETIDATSFDWVETTHLQYLDLNRDGHPDIRIVETERAVEPRNDDHYKGRKERSYLYDPARDGYLYKGQWMTYPHRPFSWCALYEKHDSDGAPCDP